MLADSIIVGFPSITHLGVLAVSRVGGCHNRELPLSSSYLSSIHVKSPAMVVVSGCHTCCFVYMQNSLEEGVVGVFNAN